MTDWEVIEKKPGGRNQSLYGLMWGKVPAVAVNKHGITVNAQFANAFCNGSSAMLIMVAKDSRKLGLKIVPNDEFEQSAFTLARVTNSKSKGSGARHCHCKLVAQKFPDTVGCAYRAHASADGRVIEVELSPENRCK